MAVGLVFAIPLLHAQIAPFGISNNNLAPVETAPPDGWDSIVQLTADYNGLQQVPADATPRAGTFWTIIPGSGGMALPWPCMPPGVNPVTYEISSGIYLVDDTATTNPVTQADLEAQAIATVNVIGLVQTAAAIQQSAAMSRVMGLGAPFPGFGGGGGDAPALTNAPCVLPDYGTNLWLQITSISNVWVNLLVSNTVADVEYQILGRHRFAATPMGVRGVFVGIGSHQLDRHVCRGLQPDEQRPLLAGSVLAGQRQHWHPGLVAGVIFWLCRD